MSHLHLQDHTLKTRFQHIHSLHCCYWHIQTLTGAAIFPTTDQCQALSFSFPARQCLYSTKFQKAIALSSTEAKFASASDAGKYALYLRSILTDLGFTQESNPTTLLIDNTGAVCMVDAAQALTRDTR